MTKIQQKAVRAALVEATKCAFRVHGVVGFKNTTMCNSKERAKHPDTNDII